MSIIGPVVSIAQGAYRGRWTGGVARFLGIAYAAPPVGDLRFAPPRPPAPHPGVADAAAYGPTVAAPPQRSPTIAELLPDPVVPGAAGLNLNVWTPDLSGSLPVLVWVHGGGFVTGTGAVTAFDGSAFARDGVVTVVLNYRLAIDGFLHLPDAVPNRGLLDQLAALTWVRDNIAAFGGDPGNVTLAGQSAGAMSVLTLLAMPGARGLFRRVIAQSGDAHHVHTAAEAALVTEEVCHRLGIAARARDLARVPVTRAHQVLNAVIGAVQAAEHPRWRALRRLVVQPVIDGDVLPEHPVRAFARGIGADVELLIGHNTDEYGLFTVPSGLADTLDAATLTRLMDRLGVDAPTLIGAYRERFPSHDLPGLFVAIQGDWFCALPILSAIDARARGGAATHAYEFAWRPTTFGGRLGACHTLEIPFVFDTLDDPWGAALRGPDAPRALAAETHATWVRFVTDGALPWPRYGSSGRLRRLDLDSATVADDRRERLPLWPSIVF